MRALFFNRVVTTCLVLAYTFSAYAQVISDPKLKLLQITAPAPGFGGDISDLAWLAGNWRTESKVGFREDTWLPLESRQMSGLNRAIARGAVAYMNFMVLRQEAGSVTMQHRNFGAALNERGTRDFTLLDRDGDYFYFTGLTLHRISNDHYEALYDFGTETQLQTTRRTSSPSATTTYTLRTEKELYPEGLAVDSARRRIWLNSTNQNKIVQSGFEGAGTTDLATPYHGKLRGTGLLLHAGLLLALGNDNYDATAGALHKSVLQVLNPADGTLLRSYEHVSTERTLFNDISVDASGLAYITNTSEGALYTIPNIGESGGLELLLKATELEGANGLCLSARSRRLFIATSEGLRIYDLSSRTFLPYQNKASAGIDGLKYHEGSLYGLRGGLVRYVLNATEDAVVREEVLIPNHPLFDAPTSLCIVENTVFLLANSQFGKRQRIEQGLADRSLLTDTYVLQYRLSSRT
jgi:hypothetical protein